MAGNPKTSKSVAPKSAQSKPGSKGVMVGMNKGKAVVQSSVPGAATSKYGMGGSLKKRGK
jgi:hypothetical protein